MNDQDLFWEYSPEINSIAVIVNHLWGNMMSRWTDFLHSDGEKEWRERDLEFEQVITSKKQMMERWEEGWNTLFDALDSINSTNFEQTIYIRSQAHSIPDAINRQLCHYAYHIGQIVYLGKMRKKSDWKSLSIPKGQSAAFNAEKNSKGKHGGHFTDDLM